MTVRIYILYTTDMKYKYTKKALQEAVNKSLSMAEVCRKLNIRPAGGNYKTIKEKLKFFNISTAHFTGQGWNTGLQCRPTTLIKPLSDILVENSTYTSSSGLKKRLIKEGLKKDECERCKISIWEGEKLALELEHVNGLNMDNRLENLKILCPNCHSLTATYRGRSKIKSQKAEQRQKVYLEQCNKNQQVKKVLPTCSNCGNLKSFTALNCKKCDNKLRMNNTKIIWPDLSQLIQMIKTLGYRKTGKILGVSDNAVRKHILMRT